MIDWEKGCENPTFTPPLKKEARIENQESRNKFEIEHPKFEIKIYRRIPKYWLVCG
jgi:hypothetical protein